MKVLIFMSQFYRLGGSERLAVELAEELNRRGIHTDIMSLYSDDLPGVKEATLEILGRGIPRIHFLDLEINPSPLSLLAATFRLRALVRRNGYGLIETSMLTPSILATLVNFVCRFQLIVGIHDVYLLSRHQGIRFALWRTMMRMGKNTRFYVISEYVKKAWLDFSGVQPNHVGVLYNGIQDQFFNTPGNKTLLTESLGIAENAKLVIFVGRMLYRKGIDIALESVGPLLKDGEVHLLFVGGDEQQEEGFFSGEVDLDNKIKGFIEQHSIERNVHFLGRRDDIPFLMASSDVLIHPARIEGFGLVLVEAMASGLPVVAAKVDGIPEVVEGSSAILVESEDVQGFRRGVDEVLNRSQLQQLEARESGLERASAFSSEKRAEEFVQFALK